MKGAFENGVSSQLGVDSGLPFWLTNYAKSQLLKGKPTYTVYPTINGQFLIVMVMISLLEGILFSDKNGWDRI